MIEEEPISCSPPSLIPSSDDLRWAEKILSMVGSTAISPTAAPMTTKWITKDVTSLKRRLENTLSMWVNGKMGIHANQAVWVEDGKAFVICWGCSCQHVPASGWILGSGFCRPFSFLWKHTLRKICFRFPKNPEIQPKWASSEHFCV